jgi:spore coat polysaccharide biosynthesis predicted glycosyltransferase SpsG
LKNPAPRILFRLDAGPLAGLGHIGRCLPVAAALAAHGAICRFLVAGGEPGPERIRAAGFAVEMLPAGKTTAFDDWLSRQDAPFDAYFFDVRDDLGQGDLRELKKSAVVAVLDDPTAKRLEADLAFYPPVPQVEELDWTGFAGKKHIGFDWVSIEPVPDTPCVPPTPEQPCAHAVPPLSPEDGPVSLLVTMGGTDPFGLSVLALRALALVKTPVAATVVVGAACPSLPLCRKLVADLGHRARLVLGPVSLPLLMAQAQAALVAFGVTAYELAARGIPAVLMGITPDHVRSASCLATANAAIIAGYYKEITPMALAAHLDRLIGDPQLLAATSNNARNLGLGQGAENIARALLRALEKRHDRA